MNVEDQLAEGPVDYEDGLVADNNFRPWGKTERIGRLFMVVTEKIDGTNAQIVIDGDRIRAGSRTRWIKVGDDNYGFAAWVEKNKDELMKLGRGRHYGEWWGSGIQRGYGLTNGEKRFSLFNTARPKETLPACVSQVPVLYHGPLDQSQLACVESTLRETGSVAAPGFMKPEGYCVFLPATGHIFKHPFDK